MYASDVANLRILLDIARVDLGHPFCRPNEESHLLHTYEMFNLVTIDTGRRLSCHLASSAPKRTMPPQIAHGWFTKLKTRELACTDLHVRNGTCEVTFVIRCSVTRVEDTFQYVR